ncbi:hypothetical protein [Nostoc sp.]
MSTMVTEPVLSVAVGAASRREGRSRSAGYAYALVYPRFAQA